MPARAQDMEIDFARWRVAEAERQVAWLRATAAELGATATPPDALRYLADAEHDVAAQRGELARMLRLDAVPRR